MSTHAPPQTVGAVLGQMQRPDEQLWPEVVQALPQPPQFMRSLAVETQPKPGQSVVPVGQRHVPKEQLCVGSQATPQPPQFAGSRSSDTQPSPGQYVPLGQTQLPLAHTSVGRQATPQPPQFRGSLSQS